MKIKNVENVDIFLDVVLKCKGKVELVTQEGDILNLKSKLCQYVALSKMFSETKTDEIGDFDIIVYEPEDMNLLFDYLISG
ncbi:MAG: polya polymerase [Oscillospiraceae bacterium]|nr:polya polymerase [Oscillospiraceae bacterium]